MKGANFPPAKAAGIKSGVGPQSKIFVSGTFNRRSAASDRKKRR